MKSKKRAAFDEAFRKLPPQRQEEIIAFLHRAIFTRGNPFGATPTRGHRTVANPTEPATILKMHRSPGAAEEK
jgi:hypothetical protein